MLAQTSYEHIALYDIRVPYIVGTTMKVVELILAQIAYGWSPEELHLQFPHLTLGQIHSAFAYYWDHQVEFEEDIAQRQASVLEIQRAAGLTSLAKRLKSRG
jgi:uncharacterized protein (DUF433 family)